LSCNSCRINGHSCVAYAEHDSVFHQVSDADIDSTNTRNLEITRLRIQERITGFGSRGLIGSLEGHTDFMCDQSTTSLPQIAGGAIKAIAVLSEQKLPQLPNVATAVSAGYSDINIRSWNALFLPKGVPDETRTRLAKALRFALSDRNLREQMAAVGVDLPDPDKAGPAEVTALIEKGIKNDVPVLRARGESLD